MNNLPRACLEIGEHSVNAWVARGAEQRALGLMHCQNLAEDEGMLFVNGEPKPQGYWMKDTPLHLSIAFIDEDGTILQVEDMDAHSLETTRSEAPVRYVLEVRQGWFAERGIGAGVVVTGPVFVDAVVAGGLPARE